MAGFNQNQRQTAKLTAEQYDEDFTLTLFTLALATRCLAQEALVTVTGKPPMQTSFTLSACMAVQREFWTQPWVQAAGEIRCGCGQNRADVETGEMQLVSWDRGLFAEAVMLLAFEELMPAR